MTVLQGIGYAGAILAALFVLIVSERSRNQGDKEEDPEP
jgi:hypothetical protein